MLLAVNHYESTFSRVLNKLPNFLYEEELPGVKQLVTCECTKVHVI